MAHSLHDARTTFLEMQMNDGGRFGRGRDAWRWRVGLEAGDFTRAAQRGARARMIVGCFGPLKVDLSRWLVLQDYVNRVGARSTVQAAMKAEGLLPA